MPARTLAVVAVALLARWLLALSQNPLRHGGATPCHHAQMGLKWALSWKCQIFVTRVLPLRHYIALNHS
jgi:hypothetical protein